MKIGVIGVGYWGPNLVRTLREINGAEVAQVADFRAGRREFIHRRFPGIATTGTPDEVIADASIEAVMIASPPETHCELAIRCLKQGKHVFVEKPMATRVRDAEEMVSCAEQSGRILAVGHLFLYHPAVVSIRRMLGEQRLGDLYFITSTRANLGPPNAASDVLWDLAPHDISIVLDLVQETPSAVVARGASFSHTGLIETAYVNLAFPSGRMAQINVSWLTPNKTRRMELVCSSKTVVYDDMQATHKLKVFNSGFDNRMFVAEGDATAIRYGPGSMWCPAIENTEPLRTECMDFIDSIVKGKEPINCGRAGLETVRVLEAASESIRESRQVQVTPGYGGSR